MLAYENKQKVLIVKSPSNHKEQKKFLGYEWSGAKGSEGIKYIGGNNLNDIITPLFNPLERNDNTKINWLIQQNFLGAKPNDLTDFEQYKDLITYANVEDILDFSRKDFNKTFSLSPKKNITIETKWELVKLGEVAEIIAGQSPSSDNYNEKGNGLAFYQGKKDFGKLYLKTPTSWTLQTTKISVKDDILMSVRAPVGDVNLNPFKEICIGRGLVAIRANHDSSALTRVL